MKKYVVTLIEQTGSTRNAYGEETPTRVERDVLAARKSTKYGEFYQAKAAGFTPENIFVVWSAEYQQETLLKYNDQEYKIIRTYETNEKDTELVCERLWKVG